MSWGSGLEPPPHLVGERARALDVLAAGGLVSASAAALAEGMPPLEARPEPIRIAPGEAPGIDGLAEQLALAGYERVEQAQERGQFALRGGIVDVYPTTGREPLRVEFFGDEIESMRAFSPFTQRTLHPVDGATIYPAAERLLDLVEPRLADERGEPARACQTISSRPVPPGRTSSGSRTRCARSGRRSSSSPCRSSARSSSTRFPPGQPFAFEAQRPAIAARGLAEAENELRALVRGGLRTVVVFPHQGEALRTQNLLRRVEARADRARRGASRRGRAPLRRQPGAARLRLARARARPAPRHAGLPPPRARPSSPRGPRPPVLRRAAHRRLRRPRGSRRRQAARLRDEGDRRHHARLPQARLPRRGPAVRPARAGRQGFALHRRRRRARPRSRSSAARRGRPAQDPSPRGDPRARRRADQALRAAAERAGHLLRPLPGLAGAPRGVVPVPGDARPARARSRP